MKKRLRFCSRIRWRCCKKLLDLVRIEGELAEIFGREVDLWVLSSVNPYIIDGVKKEMRVIYGKR